MKYFALFNIMMVVVSLQAQVPADSTNPFSVAPNILPLRDWHKFSYDELHLNYPASKPGLKYYYTPPVISENPFLVDMRGHPMYTPRFVTDELNLIMNRPRDNAFVPVLGVAFLAMQLAQKYLLISEKTAIKPADIAEVPEGLKLLHLLWQNSPQHTDQMYQDSTLSENYTMLTLQELLDKMTDNKLVRQKTVENGPIEYYPALNREAYINLLDIGLADTTLSAGQHEILHQIENSPYLVKPHMIPDEKKN
jgi:predicted transcriptional regulator